jgi:hypothetical protein
MASSRAVLNASTIDWPVRDPQVQPNGNVMIQSLHSSTYTNTIADFALAPAQRPVAAIQTSRNRHQISAQTARQSRVVPNPLVVPSFLLNRVGLTWSRIQADLRQSVSSDAEYRQILHGLLAFVETHVVGTAAHPRHGSGILMGLPLISGWRRRLFVCPESDQLMWIGG